MFDYSHKSFIEDINFAIMVISSLLKNRIFLLGGIIIFFIFSSGYCQSGNKVEVGSYYVYKQHTEFLNPKGMHANVQEHYANVNLGYELDEKFKVGLEYLIMWIKCNECLHNPYSLFGWNMNYIVINRQRVKFSFRAGFSFSNMYLKEIELPVKSWGVNGVYGGCLDLTLSDRMSVQVGYYSHQPIRHKPQSRPLTQPIIGISYAFSNPIKI